MNEILNLIDKKDYETAKKLILEMGSEAETSVELQRNLGLCNVNLGCNDEAAKNFEFLISQNVEDTLSMYYLATIYIEQEKLEEAEKLLKRVIELRDEYLNAYKTLSVCLMKQFKHAQVLDFAEKMLYLDAEDVQVYDILATASLEIGNFEMAQNYLGETIKILPEDYRYYNKLGVVFFSKGDMKNALECYEKAVSLEDKDPSLLYNLGMTYFSMEKFDLAASYLKKALEIQQKPVYLTSLGIASLKIGAYAEAAEVFELVVKLEPEKESHKYNLACAYEGLEKLEEASNIIEKLLTFNLSSVQLKLHLASLYSRRGMLEAAKNLYSDLIASGVERKEILYQFAVLCAQTNDTDKAEEIFKCLIEKYPDYSMPYKDLAIIYLDRKFFDRAAEYFKKAIKIDPENENIIFEYANYNYLMSDFEQAKKYYNKLLKKEFIPAYMLVSIALNYLEKNKLKPAKEVLLRAIAQEPKNIQVLFHLGEVYYLEKNYENARQLLEDAYNVNPNHEIANTLALTYMELGQYREAFVLFNLINLTVPNNLSVLMNLAKCQVAQEDFENAKPYLETILNILPEHEEAQTLLNEIKEKEIK